ncbi:MAG: DUF1570 domain-containing protein [Planctomycetota bacterium]|nr:DUF1570 domain-containing protein [Planctomycetota bacterium]
MGVACELHHLSRPSWACHTIRRTPFDSGDPLSKHATDIKKPTALLAEPLAAVAKRRVARSEHGDGRGLRVAPPFTPILGVPHDRNNPSQATGLTSSSSLLPIVFFAIAAQLLPGCISRLQSPDFLSTGLPLQTRLTAPRKYTVTRSQLIVHSDFELPANHRLLDDLIARSGDLSRELSLPSSDEPIHVYLFEDSQQYNSFMRVRHPNAPPTRAAFHETDTRLQVYAHWGDRVAEDLRHEVMHGYIHSVVPNAPLWLDEGLAEYFEVPRGTGGLNRTHVAWLASHLRAGDWRPDLDRLERLSPAEGMTRGDYAEAWAWVHFLLQSKDRTRRELLGNHLRRLRQHGSSEPISTVLGRFDQRASDELVVHIQRLAAEFDQAGR